MIMRKLYLEMAQIIIGSFLFDKQWGNFNAMYTTGNTIWIGSFTYPIKINTVLIATAMHYGGKDAYAAAVTNIATEATTGSWKVELNGNPMESNGTIPMRAFIIGK